MNSQRTAPRRRETTAATIAVALACLAAASALAPARAQQPAQKAKQKPPETKSVVRGRVVYDETERPVRRAKVMLYGMDDRTSEQREGLTDERGEFEIKKVDAGSYVLAVDAPGVVSPISYVNADTHLRPDLTEITKNFEMLAVDGKTAYDVTLRARRGAALSGRVTYADGDPAPGLAVHVLRRADGRHTKVLFGVVESAATVARTDDRGVFRVAGLPPGEYVVGVSESAEHDDDGTQNHSDPAGFGVHILTYGRQLFTTFHPSTRTAAEAEAVSVAAGEEREGLDIVVAEREVRVVSGRVRGRADKRPVAHARVIIVRREASVSARAAMPYGEMGQIGAWADAEGRWTLKNIPDGSYTLLVRPPEPYEAQQRAGHAGEDEAIVTNLSADDDDADAEDDASADGEAEERAAAAAATARPAPAKKHTSKTVEIEVAGGDLRDVSVELDAGAHIAGTFKFEGGTPAPPFWMLYAHRAGPASAESPSGIAGTQGDTFIIEGLAAGKYFLDPVLPPGDEQSGIYVKSITWKGRDLLREPLEVAEGEGVEGVSVAFARGAATLRVVARASGDKGPERGAHAYVVRPDAPPVISHPRRFECMTGGDGSCTVAAAPGDYFVVVSRRGLTQEEVARRAAGATRVTLSADEDETVEVTVPDN